MPKTDRGRLFVIIVVFLAVFMVGYHMYCHYMVSSFFAYLDEGDTEGALAHIEKMPNVNMRDSCYLIYRIKDVFTQGAACKGYPLDWAVYRDADIRIFEALLKKGADPNKGDYGRLSTFQEAPRYLAGNREKKMLLMIEYGADIQSIDLEIHSSRWFDSTEDEETYFDYIVTLWEMGANDRIIDINREWTVLHDAAKYLDAEHLEKIYHNEKRSMAYLLNEPDADGETPIFYAVRSNAYKNCEFLIREGADLSIENNEGKTIFEVAAEIGHKDGFLNALKRAKAD